MNGRSPVVLLEDDPGDQELTIRALEDTDIRVDVRVAFDGGEALNYLRHEGKYKGTDVPFPDLILLDLNMPRVDGKQVLRELRADPRLRRVPVVALATSRSVEDIVATYDLGANSFITKPAGIAELAETMKQLQRYWFRIVALPPIH